MGEASTWGKVWGGQALTQEVPKPVISGGWKQIPRNCCVLLTLFSYFGLCCWQLLEMKQAVTWWGKCSIPACVQKVSWQMPYEWHNLPPVSAGILPSFLGRKTQRTAWMRTEMMWSAYAKQSGKSARLFFHGENYDLAFSGILATIIMMMMVTATRQKGQQSFFPAHYYKV